MAWMVALRIKIVFGPVHDHVCDELIPEVHVRATIVDHGPEPFDVVVTALEVSFLVLVQVLI